MRNIFRKGKPTNSKLETQMEYEDPYHRLSPWPPRSKVKVAKSRDDSGRCWPLSRERNILEISKLVGRFCPTPRAIIRTSFQVKGQSPRSPGRLMLTQQMRNIFRTERPTNFTLGTQMEYEDLYHLYKRHDLQGQRSRSQSHVMILTGVGRHVEKETS